MTQCSTRRLSNCVISKSQTDLWLMGHCIEQTSEASVTEKICFVRIREYEDIRLVRVKIECVDHPRVDSVGKGSCQLMPKLLLPR